MSLLLCLINISLAACDIPTPVKATCSTVLISSQRTNTDNHFCLYEMISAALETLLFHTYSCSVRFISAASNPISPTFNLNGIDLPCTVKDFAPEVLGAMTLPLLMHCTLITLSFDRSAMCVALMRICWDLTQACN